VYLAADVVLRKLRALNPEDTSGARKAVNLKDLVIELRRWLHTFKHACMHMCACGNVD
jgi:hypothetical protein